jgi:hypothetical protein
MEGYVSQDSRFFILTPPTPLVTEDFILLVSIPMKVCKKAIRVLGEGLLTPFESIGLNMMGE